MSRDPKYGKRLTIINALSNINVFTWFKTTLDVKGDFTGQVIPKGSEGTIVECYENPEGYAVDLAIPDPSLVGVPTMKKHGGASLSKFKGLEITIVDPEGNVLWEGQLTK